MGGDTTTAWRLCYCRQTRVKVFLFPFVYRLYTGDKLRSLPNDQPELIGAEEIIFHPFSPLAMNNQLWLEKLHRSIPVFASETAKL